MLPKVLIVEDDEVIREIYAIKFELAGFTCDVAENGAVALSKIAQFEPNIVLLDLMMPVMDGHAFLEALGPKARDLDIIIFSNVSAPTQLEAAMKLGAKDYWVKSDYTPDRVAQELVRRWQRGRKSS